ncbi:MAG: 2-polyprenyl-3-methyl-6-methoxy-1,4-benzoquinone monooxygenase [Halieaceae bacterium]|nr:2-polyprenyl-3-methyl-6-methoxy-1,4-benzoquinone monooxygenase [Halieaceae bacterium]
MATKRRLEQRSLTGLDRLISGVDERLRQLTGQPSQSPASSRPSPALAHQEPALSARERDHAGALMRVNHTGEVCAQALYQGQALAARSDATRQSLLSAAQEEADHLAWCETRLQELDARPSRLNPLFYAASFALGAITAAAGDKVSLGFVHATEERVAGHLRAHLKSLPGEDRKSQLILQQMLADEERHGEEALALGGQEFTRPIKDVMTVASQVMTRTTYWI